VIRIPFTSIRLRTARRERAVPGDDELEPVPDGQPAEGDTVVASRRAAEPGPR